MPAPRLNRIPIEIRASVRAGLEDDDTQRRPAGLLDASGTLVEIRGQWQEDARARERARHSGNEATSLGYFIVTARDLADLVDAGTPIAVGDEIVSKGGVDLDPRHYVVEIRDKGHVARAGGGTLRFVHFHTRRPNR